MMLDDKSFKLSKDYLERRHFYDFIAAHGEKEATCAITTTNESKEEIAQV